MKTFFRVFATLTALTACSISSNAKVFDLQHLPSRNPVQLRDGDNFSVECRNNRTGVIDRETVDVDAATLTIEIPDSEPVVHHITTFSINARQIYDRFGQPGMELYVDVANWGQGSLILSRGRWLSQHEDSTLWTCAD
jgi:hypothetical protein